MPQIQLTVPAEQPDGTWGAGGQIIRYADLVALANPADAGPR